MTARPPLAPSAHAGAPTVRVPLPALLVLLALLVPACAPDGGDGADTPGGARASFVAVDVDFAEAPESLPAGDVTVELVNEGSLDHNITFEGVGGGAVAQASGGETATGTVTLEPGEVVAYCSVPGHREAGMEATITVDG